MSWNTNIGWSTYIDPTPEGIFLLYNTGARPQCTWGRLYGTGDDRVLVIITLDTPSCGNDTHVPHLSCDPETPCTPEMFGFPGGVIPDSPDAIEPFCRGPAPVWPAVVLPPSQASYSIVYKFRPEAVVAASATPSPRPPTSSTPLTACSTSTTLTTTLGMGDMTTYILTLPLCNSFTFAWSSSGGFEAVLAVQQPSFTRAEPGTYEAARSIVTWDTAGMPSMLLAGIDSRYGGQITLPAASLQTYGYTWYLAMLCHGEDRCCAGVNVLTWSATLTLTAGPSVGTVADPALPSADPSPSPVVAHTPLDWLTQISATAVPVLGPAGGAGSTGPSVVSPGPGGLDVHAAASGAKHGGAQAWVGLLAAVGGIVALMAGL